MLLWLLVAYAADLTMNIMPAFMPPSWSVLAFFYVHNHLPLLLLTLGGAVTSSVGRTILALMTRRWGRRLLRQKQRADLRQLGEWLGGRPAWQVPSSVVLLSLGPVPSNQLFIAAGLTGMRLLPVVSGFLVGRAIFYTASAIVAQTTVTSLEGTFSALFRPGGAVLVEVLALGGLVLFTKIDWPKLLRLTPQENETQA